MSIEAMKPALDALEKSKAALAEELGAWDIDPPLHHILQALDLCDPAIAALSTAIAEAEKQEPVLEVVNGQINRSWDAIPSGFTGLLYTTPPAAQQVAPEGWKLVPAVPTNEWVNNLARMQTGSLEEVSFVEIHQCIAELLDAAPNVPAAQRKPLRGEKLVDMARAIAPRTVNGWSGEIPNWIVEYGRAIERKHGIGGKA